MTKIINLISNKILTKELYVIPHSPKNLFIVEKEKNWLFDNE